MEPGSKRNGGVTLTVVVTPDEARAIDTACARTGFTRGRLLAGAAVMLGQLGPRACSHAALQFQASGQLMCLFCKESTQL